jgi:hypothetical protein
LVCKGSKRKRLNGPVYVWNIKTFTLCSDNIVLMQSQPADLEEKTRRYMVMLEGALEEIETSVGEKSYLNRVADDYLTMACSYYNDGKYFMENGDLVNALVCFSYGHAWLDAGVRLGVFVANDERLFAV